MTIKISQIYQKRKIVYVYLDTNEEIQNLNKQAGDRILLHLGTWQMWGERAIEDAWKNKTHDWVIWPHQTSRLNRWVVLVINVKDGKSAIHTASQDTEHAKAEKGEIENFLGGLKDFNFSDENPALDTDDGLDKKDELGSACLAICYVKTVLEQISKGSYSYDISSSDFDERGEDGKPSLKNLLKKIEQEYNDVLTQARKLDKLEELVKEIDLKSAKLKYKNENFTGDPWTLTTSEINRIDQATNQEDLEKVVKKIMQERDEAGKLEKWIKEKISDQTEVEKLPKKTDIDKTDFSARAKQQIKWKLQERIIELMSATTPQGKIKQHLSRVEFDWERWDYLVQQKDQTNPTDYAMALMFADGSGDDKQGFGKTVAKEMLPKIIAALTKDTLEDYRNLDKEWSKEGGQIRLDENGKVKYNEKRDYYGVWQTLQEYLQADSLQKDEWKEVYLRGTYGQEGFKEVQEQYQNNLQAQVEVPTNN